MKKVYTCGDSFAYPDPRYSGEHYSEIIAKELGYGLVIYSYPGCGDGLIGLQIEEARKNKADLVLIRPSFHRFEFQFRPPPEDYDRFLPTKLSLKNFKYDHLVGHLVGDNSKSPCPETDEIYKDSDETFLISMTNGMIENVHHQHDYGPDIDENMLNKFRAVLETTYFPMKHWVDDNMLANQIQLLINDNIPFVFLPPSDLNETLYPITMNNPVIQENALFCLSLNDITAEYVFKKIFHTKPEVQRELAKKILSKIHKNY